MIVEQAYLEMFPEAKSGDYDFICAYSGKFKGYNANIKRQGNRITVCLSSNWKGIGDEVKMGLIQHLLNKLLGSRIKTTNMDLYEIFLKKVHMAVKKTKNDTALELSFIRVNNRYFNGVMEQPNLEWGQMSTTKLGSYDYGSDTVRISAIFRDANYELLDFIMYHELLHKKHKFRMNDKRSTYHSRDFQRDERDFDDFNGIESELNRFVSSMRRGKGKRFFFS